MFKATCSRCGGEGKLWNHLAVQGGVCFKCNGNGFTMVKTDPKKLKAQKEKRAAKKTSDLENRVIEGAKRQELRKEKYENDPRIGEQCRQRCEEFDLYADETYRTLENIDTGVYSHGIESLPNITE